MYNICRKTKLCSIKTNLLFKIELVKYLTNKYFKIGCRNIRKICQLQNKIYEMSHGFNLYCY